MTLLGISVNTEQELISIVSELNADYWAGELTDKQREIIKKFGSKEEAMQQTFIILWQGMVVAIKSLKTVDK